MVKYESQTEYWVDTKTGKMRYEFENMYQDYNDPWGCEKDSSSLNNRILVNLIHEYEPNGLLNIGCGMGGVLSQIYSSLKPNPAWCLGVDVSQTACAYATKRYPHISFKVADIMCDKILFENKCEADMVIMSEVLWYVCESLEITLKHIKHSMSQQGVFVVKQYFPKNQLYFKNHISGYSGFYETMVSSGFIIDKAVHSVKHDGVVVLASFKLTQEE